MPPKVKPGVLDLKRPLPHTGHLLVRRAMAGRHYIYICAHRGWRKSTFIIDDMLDYLETGRNAGMYAMNFSPLRNNYIELRNTGVPEEWFNKSEYTFTLPGAGSCRQFSMENPDAARGWTFGRVYVEEAGAWGNGLRESVVYPVAKKIGGTVIETGTPDPANPYNEFYELLHDARNFPEHRFAKIIPALGAKYNAETGELDFPDILDPWCNPVPFPEAAPDYDSQREQMKLEFRMARNKKRWRIEWLCEFLTDDGGQFEGVEAACIVPCVSRSEKGYEEWWDEAYLAADKRSGGWFQTGIDVGFDKDFTVITVLDRNTMRQVYMRRFKPQGSRKYDEVRAAIYGMSKLFPATPIVDVTGAGRSLKDEPFLVPHDWNVGNKAPLYDHLAALIGGQKVKLFDHIDLKFELTMVQRTARTTGGFKIEGAKNSHDDIPASLALMVKDVPAREDSVLAGDFLGLKLPDNPWAKQLTTSQW